VIEFTSRPIRGKQVAARQPYHTLDFHAEFTVRAGHDGFAEEIYG